MTQLAFMSRSIRAILCVVALAVTAAACDSIPLFAPSESTITISSATRILPINGSAEITAVVLERGGTPVQNGTTVRFSTSLGRVDPVEVQTTNGIALATNAIRFTIGAAAASTISVRANPSAVPATGGTGSRGVLEVRCYEAPFALEHGQMVGRLVYERMAETPDVLYGTGIGSNYQGQELRLSKHFKMV